MKKQLLLCCLLVSVIGIGGLVAYYFVQSQRSISPSAPVFIFAREVAPEWWSAGNTNPHESVDPQTYQYGPPEELPNASISVHHDGPGQDAKKSNCFVSASHHTNHLEHIDDAYDTYRSDEDEWGTKRIQLGEKQLTMQTPEGKKPYTLLQYHAQHPQTGEQYLEGVQVGFINLAQGHIRIQGICKKPSDLNAALPILAAISLQ